LVIRVATGQPLELPFCFVQGSSYSLAALPCAAGNTALAQAMCGAVVDVAAMVVALPAPAAASAAGSGGGRPQRGASGEAQLLLPYPAALRHNDCHYVYQASWTFVPSA
jgi:hypothetical protein